MVVPVPGLAASIRWLSVVEGRELADSVDEVVSLEAGSAGSRSIMGGAVVTDRDADSVSVEYPVL